MAKSTSTSERKPNILVIFGDDIGVTNVSSAYSGGLMGYETPNIDRIGKEGVSEFNWSTQHRV
jgi:arylsulfatase A-like enzyme